MMNRMTKGKFDKLFLEWKQRLGLNLWDIKYEWKEIDEWTMGENTLNYEYLESDILFPEKLLKNQPDYIEKTIIHELLHCYLGFYTRPMELLNINKNQIEPIFMRFKDREETIVCTLQNILYNMKYQ